MGTRVRSCVRVRSCARTDDALIRGMCASAAPSPSLACIYIHASGYTDARIAVAGSPLTRVPRAASVRARARVCDWAPTHPRRHMRARSAGVDRGWLGSQAFRWASAFNANIGAWNTAAVTTLSYVCAGSSARRRATAGGTRSAGRRCGAGLQCCAGRCARAVVRGGTADARARVSADVWARACAGVHVCRYSCS
jgi:hypothetical protein